jgi:hypothetical protein
MSQSPSSLVPIVLLLSALGSSPQPAAGHAQWVPDASLDATARMDRAVRVTLGLVLHLEAASAGGDGAGGGWQGVEPRVYERLLTGLATTDRLVAAAQVAVSAATPSSTFALPPNAQGTV